MRQGVQQADPLPTGDEQREPSWDSKQAISAAAELSLHSTSPGSSHASGSAQRLLIIPAETKRGKKAPVSAKPARHLSSRLRHSIVLVITLLALGGTLLTLAPLAIDQHAVSLPLGLGALIQSAGSGIQSLVAHQLPQPAVSHSSPPPMTIPHNQLVALAEQDATDAGISPTYFVRQINLESGFNPNAVSPGGAEGIAQFEPATAAGLGIDPFNPTQALKAAAQMMTRYANQYGGYDKALAAYNAGPASLQSAENSCGDQWLSCMPAETQHYVSTIIGS